MPDDDDQAPDEVTVDCAGGITLPPIGASNG